MKHCKFDCALHATMEKSASDPLRPTVAESLDHLHSVRDVEVAKDEFRQLPLSVVLVRAEAHGARREASVATCAWTWAI